MQPPLSDPAGGISDGGRTRWSMPRPSLLEEALPPLRDSTLCKLREDDRCFICALHYDLLGQELDQDTHRKPQCGALCRGGTLVGQEPPPCLLVGAERRPDSIEEWDTRFSEGDSADVKCDGPCKARRRGNSGAFRDARTRAATASLRPIIWGTGQASGLWNCGVCWQREFNDNGGTIPTPMAAADVVRRSPRITVLEDPQEQADDTNPIS